MIAFITIYTLTPPRCIIPTDLATILNTYIINNDMIKNDFLFGKESTDYKEHNSQSRFTEKLQNSFFKYAFFTSR